MSKDTAAEMKQEDAMKPNHAGFAGGSDDIMPEMYLKIDGIIDRYWDKPGSLIPVLRESQEVCGYLPHSVQRYIAKGMQMSPSVVFGVATFYSFFSLIPRGKNVVRICLGTACYVKRSEEVLDKLKHELGIEVGEVTRDKKYSIETVRCLGACGLAPVMVIGPDTYGAVEATQVMDIIKKYE